MNVKSWPDIKFFAVAELHENELSASFRIYDMGDVSVPYGQKWPWELSEFSEEDLEICIEGWVKKYGCINWLFEECRNGNYFHACKRDELLRYGEVLARCWDWAGELIPEFDPC